MVRFYFLYNYYYFFILNISGSGEHQLDGAQRFLLDALNAQMQRLLRENNEELYERIERLENRERHEEERRGGNGGGPRPN